ncbi:hypothetical protein Pcinc_010757, partial [Petrolisthes cinctipes]
GAGGNLSNQRCRPLYPGAPIPYRCRRRGMNGISQRIRSVRREPEEMLTVLEIIEEDNQDGTKVVEILEEDILQGVESPYTVSMPTKANAKTPRCGPHQIYIAELDLCEDMAGHIISDSEEDEEKKKEHHHIHHPHHTQPIRVVKVGRIEKKKCVLGQMWVPEVDLCMDIDPAAPLPPL